MELMTVGQMKKLLNQAQDKVPVVICVSIPGDARKKQSPWMPEFRLSMSDTKFTDKGRDTLVITAVSVPEE